MIGDATTAKCPGCSAQLRQARVSHGVLAGCTQCGGLWIDNAEGAAIIAAKASKDEREFIRALSEADPAGKSSNATGYREPAAHEGRHCPVCQQALAPSLLADPEIVVDVCAAHGTFFDRLELAAVVCHADVKTVAHLPAIDRERWRKRFLRSDEPVTSALQTVATLVRALKIDRLD